MSYIEMNDIVYHYPLQKKAALRHVTLNLERGKFYGIIGENGGGKTTLCNLIRGLVPHFYNGKLKGTCLIDGKDIRDLDLDDLCVKIGYVFQDPFTQISGVKETVFEEIAMGLENLGVPKAEMVERVKAVCHQVGIEDLIQKNPNALSGGQRQRVAFASIIVMNAETLVIDEPTSQLDPDGTRSVFAIIDTLRNSGKTIILVEHKIDLIAKYCDEIIVMEGGEVAFHGPTAEILANPEIENHGVMMPQAAVFGHAMEAAGKPLGRIPVTVEAAVRLAKERMGS